MTKTNNSIKCVFAALLIVCSSVCQAQEDPPPMAMPTENNKVLIDEVIRVTNYETYFREYCLEKIKQYATEHKWTANKKEEIIKSIDFKYFNSTVYNQYAFHSTEDLKRLIELFKALNKNKVQKLVVTSDIVQRNLELFTQSVIEGKYVM